MDLKAASRGLAGLAYIAKKKEDIAQETLN